MTSAFESVGILAATLRDAGMNAATSVDLFGFDATDESDGERKSRISPEYFSQPVPDDLRRAATNEMARLGIDLTSLPPAGNGETSDRIVFAEQANEEDGAKELDQICVEAIQFGREFDIEPPPLPVLIYPVAVRGRLTIISADGGTHKTNLMMAAVMQLATGVPLVGDLSTALQFRVQGITSLMLTAEDDELDLQHRRRRWIERARQLSGVGVDYVQRLREGIDRVHLKSLAASVVTLYRRGGPTAAMQALERLCRRIPELQLLVLDPAASLFDGDVSDARDFGGFIKELRGLASRLNIAILLLHHVAKGPAQNAARTGEMLDHHSALGTVMLANNARVAAVVQRMTEPMASEWGIEKDQVRHYIGLSVTKANGLEPMHDPQWFRIIGGVPVPAQLQRATLGDKARAAAEAEVAARLSKLAVYDRRLAQAAIVWATEIYTVESVQGPTAFTDQLAHQAGVPRRTARIWVEAQFSAGTLVLDDSAKASNRSKGTVRPGDMAPFDAMVSQGQDDAS